ncbi:MAG TPA: patatin-like phospholipase family protein [Tepidisphaeraceae bacterium]|jgi:predicted acylesterase/phospholipase RssA|nr:patatin-like phospholipase family protein [Tepidisphaeraceae bacterium]
MSTNRLWTFAFLVPAFLVLGCSNANVQLNDTRIPLQNRARNNTRSAVFAEVASPADQDPASTLNVQNTVRPNSPSHADGETPAGVIDKDGYFVGVALSGGGSRSANFSAACMFQLERVGLMKHVDYISSVSGGSLAAAYYCAHGPDEWNPANVQKHLSHAFATDLIFRSFLPWNIFAFTVSDWDRSDVLAGVFREQLFSEGGRPLTYADLRRDRPRLLINSTDLQTGRRFVFCNETFDELNSDLSRYPLSYAVAASAAFPVVLHPVTLRDYSTIFPQYRHLIDGGVADNLGLQTLVETYVSQVESAAAAGRADPYPHGAVIVIINAQTKFNARLSSQSDLGLVASLSSSAGLTSHSLVNRASSATLAETIVSNARDDVTAKELRAHIAELDKNGFVSVIDKTGHPVRVIYISLSQLDSIKNLPFENFSEAVNTIDTYFNIKIEEAFNLYQAADLIMKGGMEAHVRGIVQEIETGVPATQPATVPSR